MQSNFYLYFIIYGNYYCLSPLEMLSKLHADSEQKFVISLTCKLSTWYYGQTGGYHNQMNCSAWIVKKNGKKNGNTNVFI
jgi:hypothetical protein